MKKITTYAKAHKIITTVVAIIILGSGWWIYSKTNSASAETRYVLGTVEKGTIIASVSASGQVSSSNQLDIKPKASGDVVYIGVQPGQKVAAGTLIAQLDTTEAQKSVRDAQANLESAQIALEKLKKPASALTLTQAQNALTNAQDALVKLYSDSNTDVTNVFLDLPEIITNLEDILIGSNSSTNGQWYEDYYANAISGYDSRGLTFKNTAHNDYAAAKKAYDTAFNEYQSLGNKPDNASIEKALIDSYGAVQLTSKALRSTNAFIQLYIDIYEAHDFTPISAATTALTDLNTFTGKVNTHLSALLSDTNSLKQDKQNIIEKQQSLDETTSGADSLDIRSSELSLTKAQNALQDANNNLANYYIRAPFAGTIASVGVKKYDSASSGTVVATLITSQKIAELSLNEVDVAKIKIGNKVTLTFDAIENLSLTGQVAEIDTIGTVSQGVVSYKVKIGFDSQDERIKSGMTVNSSIQTDVKQDVLSIPSSAVKTQNGVTYVQVFNPSLTETGGAGGVVSAVPPTQVEVKTGISDDTKVEILEGLKEGDQIVTRTIGGAATANGAASSNAPRGGLGGGGQVIRF